MKGEQKLPEYLTLQEVSRMLEVHPDTLREWDKKGTLQAARIGVKRIRQYRKSDVDGFTHKSSN